MPADRTPSQNRYSKPQKTGERCDREGIYRSECKCHRIASLPKGAPLPRCSLHGQVDWHLMSEDRPEY